MKLLTRSNTKTIKGEGRGFVTFILHLAPAKLSGYEVCGGRSPECTKLCLNMAGRGKFDRTQVARIKKTLWFFRERISFMAQLVKDISAAIRYAQKHKLHVAIRLNGTSDIPWESIRCGNFDNIMERYPFIQFYDYTKLVGRKNIPANYHLTFSASETNSEEVKQAMLSGMNVAVVFDSVPSMYAGRPVINGDEDDLRFLDPTGHIVGLKAKGTAVGSQSIFIVRNPNGSTANHKLARSNVRNTNRSGGNASVKPIARRNRGEHQGVAA
ncbi:hypothetical protein UFOVP236_66 [uncultured Caudovirales phage]|uniref:Gene product 88 domain-containing protein n=1 Tax=uncultured Caudovirales phage TaxID=2100421 RepID=A0A6J7WRV7_9CAUD|nr:hypothetical protein UFOVP236_66 [uncultured Caudovirales phage]